VTIRVTYRFFSHPALLSLREPPSTQLIVGNVREIRFEVEDSCTLKHIDSRNMEAATLTS